MCWFNRIQIYLNPVFLFSIPVFDCMYIGIKITLKCNLPGVTQHGFRLSKSNFSCGDKKKSENFGKKSMQRHRKAAKKINKKTKSRNCICFVFNKENVAEPKENYARNVSPLSETLPGIPSPGLPGGVN